jgi:hypothetical protein
MMRHAKFQRGWYVTNLSNGIKGKIVDVISAQNGYEYTIQVSGTMSTYLTFGESSLIREGNQNDKYSPK